MRFSHIACCLVLFAASVSVAQEPAGVHHMKAGSAEVITLQDSQMQLNASLLRGIDAAALNSILGSNGPGPASDNAFLIRTGGHTVLVDAGNRPQPSGGNSGQLAERLRSAGVKPESVEAVLITHMHGDHIGGLLTLDGKRAFPNARVRMAQAEYDYYLNPALEKSANQTDRDRYKQTTAAFAPYIADGSVRPFAPGEAPFAGVTAIPIPGHTPGHTAYAVGSGKDAVWFVGDIVHFGKVQFKRPDATVSFDVDTARAKTSRIEILQKAAQSGAIVAGAHLLFPGMGRVKADGSGFDWIPVTK
jgi:glyoxylase-like metal-dependent hydrolase (beta-lactamase superfamily II)